VPDHEDVEVDPTPVDAIRDRFPERLARCVAGLAVFGIGISLVIEARLGAGPWDVLHQGISKRSGISLGTVLVIVGLLLLLLWIPLRQRPGIGTILNAVEIGIVADIVIALVPAPDNLALRWLLLALGITATAIGSGIYIGAGLGSGPRDGIMMGLTRHGLSVRVAPHVDRGDRGRRSASCSAARSASARSRSRC
jgi:uncharacterized membrane protein YczE